MTTTKRANAKGSAGSSNSKARRASLQPPDTDDYAGVLSPPPSPRKSMKKQHQAAAAVAETKAPRPRRTSHKQTAKGEQEPGAAATPHALDVAGMKAVAPPSVWGTIDKLDLAASGRIQNWQFAGLLGELILLVPACMFQQVKGYSILKGC